MWKRNYLNRSFNLAFSRLGNTKWHFWRLNFFVRFKFFRHFLTSKEKPQIKLSQHCFELHSLRSWKKTFFMGSWVLFDVVRINYAYFKVSQWVVGDEDKLGPKSLTKDHKTKNSFFMLGLMTQTWGSLMLCLCPFIGTMPTVWLLSCNLCHSDF